MPTADLEQDFLGLRNSGWSITSEQDPHYNCVAFAVYDTRQFWDANLIGVRGYYWPPGVPRDDSLASWVRAFEMNSYRVCADGELEPGVEKIAIYVDEAGIPQHVARQLAYGAWTSKLGKSEDIRHPALTSLEGDLYGKVAVFMMRRPPQS